MANPSHTHSLPLSSPEMKACTITNLSLSPFPSHTHAMPMLMVNLIHLFLFLSLRQEPTVTNATRLTWLTTPIHISLSLSLLKLHQIFWRSGGTKLQSVGLSMILLSPWACVYHYLSALCSLSYTHTGTDRHSDTRDAPVHTVRGFGEAWSSSVKKGGLHMQKANRSLGLSTPTMHTSCLHSHNMYI